ncbi:hypothetical protein [Brucella pseudogrignonensis]|uniref:hypothetical protein n=1 Tax=Brucella pseudogrignonensis TaxID=419475 RepID=UPI003ECC6479
MQTLEHHVGYSRENECWFVRFYPYQTEQQAKDAVSAFTRPAAPVEGLRNVGHIDQEYLVYRSQAEAIIAAERAHKKIWMEKAAIEAERVSKLEADNAALTARVKELSEQSKADEDFIEALETQLAALKDAAKSVEDWWLSEGMNHFHGAPYCIFAIRAALEVKP